jgi:hypothetical protein
MKHPCQLYINTFRTFNVDVFIRLGYLLCVYISLSDDISEVLMCINRFVVAGIRNVWF